MKTKCCYFAALEPTWYHFITSDEIKGLLNLSLLFNEHLYINDIQLADNPHIYNSYIQNRSNPNDLYGTIVQFIKAGAIKVLMRDKIFIPPSRTLQSVVDRDCQGIADIYQTWKSYDLQYAGVIPDYSDNRDRYNNQSHP